MTLHSNFLFELRYKSMFQIPFRKERKKERKITMTRITFLRTWNPGSSSITTMTVCICRYSHMARKGFVCVKHGYVFLKRSREEPQNPLRCPSCCLALYSVLLPSYPPWTLFSLEPSGHTGPQRGRWGQSRIW